MCPIKNMWYAYFKPLKQNILLIVNLYSNGSITQIHYSIYLKLYKYNIPINLTTNQSIDYNKFQLNQPVVPNPLRLNRLLNQVPELIRPATIIDDRGFMGFVQ
ncbi:hypothetical protein Hanom_Chr15g01395501 [Helianthus anomalus]